MEVFRDSNHPRHNQSMAVSVRMNGDFQKVSSYVTDSPHTCIAGGTMGLIRGRHCVGGGGLRQWQLVVHILTRKTAT